MEENSELIKQVYEYILNSLADNTELISLKELWENSDFKKKSDDLKNEVDNFITFSLCYNAIKEQLKIIDEIDQQVKNFKNANKKGD